ncbi:hypothetical protein OG21DRAFT_1509634 [Imleria badia]|nr:hypothetical protein OG21DRAFT_1509634 [Imleria badia]
MGDNNTTFRDESLLWNANIVVWEGLGRAARVLCAQKWNDLLGADITLVGDRWSERHAPAMYLSL